MLKNIIQMKQFKERLTDGNCQPSLNQTPQIQQITAENFEEITSKNANIFFDIAKGKTVELVHTMPNKRERTIYHFNYIG